MGLTEEQIPNVSEVLHACSDCTTQRLPTAAIDNSFVEMDLHQRLAHHRAFAFTTAIVLDIEAANQAGIGRLLFKRKMRHQDDPASSEKHSMDVISFRRAKLN